MTISFFAWAFVIFGLTAIGAFIADNFVGPGDYPDTSGDNQNVGLFWE